MEGGEIMPKKILLAVLSIMLILSTTSSFSESVSAEGKKYKTEYGTPKYKTVSGYAGNQPSNGTRFKTGGGFYLSTSGGPKVSASIAFPTPFISYSLSAQLGNKAASGIFVNAPNKKDYFKIHVSKRYKITPYVTYVQVKDPVHPKQVKWKVYARGHNKSHVSTDAYAKKVN